MVCCDIIRVMAPVWSCQSCYHVFHLNCIKKWARSPASQADGKMLNNKKIRHVTECFHSTALLTAACCSQVTVPPLTKASKFLLHQQCAVFHHCHSLSGKSIYNRIKLFKIVFPDTSEGWRCPACQNVALKPPTSYTCFCGE